MRKVVVSALLKNEVEKKNYFIINQPEDGLYYLHK